MFNTDTSEVAVRSSEQYRYDSPDTPGQPDTEGLVASEEVLEG